MRQVEAAWRLVLVADPVCVCVCVCGWVGGCDTPRVHAITRLEWRQRLVLVADPGMRLWGQWLFDDYLYSWLSVLMAASRCL
jgi:hypothetical protein